MEQWLITGLSSAVFALVSWTAAREFRRGDRTETKQVGAAINLATLQTELNMLKEASREHSALQIIVAELKAEVRNLRADMRDMSLTFREVITGSARPQSNHAGPR